MTICIKCNQNEVPPYRKTKCDDCAKADESAYKANQKKAQPLPQGVPVNPEVQKIPATGNELVPETGNFQSTVWTHSVSANSFEVGKVGDRFKLYFETVEDLKIKITELKAAGFMKEDFEPEHVPHD